MSDYYLKARAPSLVRTTCTNCGDSLRAPLTRRLADILEFLRAYIAEHGYAPSFEEIAERFAYSSLATVHEHLTNLERKGWIRRAYNESRAIELMPAPGSRPDIAARLAELRRINSAYHASCYGDGKYDEVLMEAFLNTFDTVTIEWLIDEAGRGVA